MKRATNTEPRSGTRAAGAYLSDDAKWRAVVAKDANADGQFVFAVETTGVYCRPSCKSRPALRKNVAFYVTTDEAEAAGFRPCKRCSPNGLSLADSHAEVVARACRCIESSENEPDLSKLAKVAGMSASHLHRTFKAVTGMTPKQYATAHRAQRVRSALGKRGSVTEAIYDAGFQSSGRFYAQSAETLGMTPRTYQRGALGETIRFAVGDCSLGSILVAASDKGVCAITLGDDPDALARDLQDRFRNARIIGGDTGFERTVARVIGLIESPRKPVTLPLDVRGTVFQQKVWQALQKIPPGKTMSYSEIANQIGLPKATRAVARACASNAIAVAIPCHRVVRTDGALSGYRWGVERKQALLEREGVASAIG